MTKLSKLLTALGLSLALQACVGSSTLIPLTTKGALDSFKPIANSGKAPCKMQRDVAAHNSAYDSLKSGREVVYKAPCDLKPKPPKSKPTV